MVETTGNDLAGLRRSPLHHLRDALEAATVTGSRAVAVREVPFLNMVGVRVDPESDMAQRLSAITGLRWPARHGAVEGTAEGTAVLWQGPDEFLVVSQDAVELPAALVDGPADDDGALPTISTHPLTVELAEAMAGTDARGQVVDLSANRTTLELSGPSAREVLEKGCPLDLHPRSFPVNTAVSTTLGPVQLVLWRCAEQTWRLMPRASFAQFVADWLLDAMTEFAAEPVP